MDINNFSNNLMKQVMIICRIHVAYNIVYNIVYYIVLCSRQHMQTGAQRMDAPGAAKGLGPKFL